jgi:hypothetical protein
MFQAASAIYPSRINFINSYHGIDKGLYGRFEWQAYAPTIARDLSIQVAPSSPDKRGYQKLQTQDSREA